MLKFVLNIKEDPDSMYGMKCRKAYGSWRFNIIGKNKLEVTNISDSWWKKVIDVNVGQYLIKNAIVGVFGFTDMIVFELVPYEKPAKEEKPKIKKAKTKKKRYKIKNNNYRIKESKNRDEILKILEPYGFNESNLVTRKTFSNFFRTKLYKKLLETNIDSYPTISYSVNDAKIPMGLFRWIDAFKYTRNPDIHLWYMEEGSSTYDALFALGVYRLRELGDYRKRLGKNDVSDLNTCGYIFERYHI